MSGKTSFYRETLGMAFALCAVICLFPAFVYAETRQADLANSLEPAFRRQLTERSQVYLESIRKRAAELPPEQRIRMVMRAQNVVNKGLAEFQRPSGLLQKPGVDPIDPETVRDAFRKIDGSRNKPELRKALAFLDTDFHQPSELDVALNVAVPPRFSRERRQVTLITANHPFSRSMFGFSGFAIPGSCDMITPSVSPRDAKTMARVLGLHFVSPFFEGTNISWSRLFEDQNLLAGFPQIARTVVLRI